MHLNKSFQQGLLAFWVISLVACGGGGGGGSNKSSTPASVAPSSIAASSVALSSTPTSSVAPSSTPASSVAPSSTPVSSSEASSSALSSTPQSSSSSSIAVGVTTTFHVSITPPQLNGGSLTKSGRNVVAKKAAQDEALPLNQLAVVIVDVSGEVIETIPLVEGENATQNPDGTWTLNIPGYPRLDCVVIANLNGPITLIDGDSLFDLYPNALLSPTTTENLEVGLAATAAYQNLLDGLGGEGTFESLDLDVNDPVQLSAIQNLIQAIADVLDDQTFIGATSVADALAEVQQQVAGIVQVEVTNIQTQVDPTATTLAMGLQAGGIFWFEGFEPSEIFYGGFSALNVPEQERHYDGVEFVPLPEFDNDGDVVLTNQGWVVTSDNFEASALNEDGSVTLSNSEAGAASFNAKASQVINLNGRNIASFFGAYSDTRGIASQINPNSNFGEGTLAYRASLTSTSDTYSLWHNPGYDNPNDDIVGAVCPWDRDGNVDTIDLASNFGGNCELVGGLTWVEGQSWTQNVPNMTSMNQLISADVVPGVVGAKLISINWPDGDVIAVQLIDNANKTARYYRHNWQTNIQTLIGTGTWTQQNLPNLEADASAITLELPVAVIAQGDFDADEDKVLFAKHNGFIRLGNKSSEGKLLETGILLINHTATDNLLAAFNYQPAIAGAWVIGGDYVMFRKDGTFAQVKVSNEDPNCQVGFAYGQYNWNPTTSAFSVAMDEDTTAVNPADSCSVAGIETLAISGTTMTLTEGEDTFEATKVTPTESAPLAGAWAVSGDWFTFTADNTFIHAKIENDDPNCHTGWANGSFTWDAGTGLFNGTVNQDFTDDDPETTCTLDGEINTALDGNSLLINVDVDELTLKRFGNPLN